MYEWKVLSTKDLEKGLLSMEDSYEDLFSLVGV